MKVFSKEKYLERWPMDASWEWVNECDGKPVVNGFIDGYSINDLWCIEKEDEPMQKYTMKDFIEKKIAVKISTADELDMFLKMCDARKLVWNGGESAVAWKPKWTTPLEIACNVITSNRITWGKIGTATRDGGYELVNFTDITDETTPTYEIHIKCVNDVTTAEMVVNGKVVKSSKAKRDPRDKFSFKTGAEYAFNRLFEKKEKEVKTPKNGIKSRDGFTIGDRVIGIGMGTKVGDKYGRVIGFPETGTLILVEFDDDIGGHLTPVKYDQSLLVKKGHNWWCFPDQIKRV